MTYVGDANDPATILADSNVFYCTYFDNRDDVRGFPVDPFRERVMPAWGAYTADRDGKWNTDPVFAGLFTYAMAAFARRVADHPSLHDQYGTDAIRFVTATIETYEAFRPELHLVESD